MLINHVRLGSFVIVLLVIAAGLASAPAAAMEPVTAWCNADFLTPDEPLDSIGLGLTHAELDALYGQGSPQGIFGFTTAMGIVSRSLTATSRSGSIRMGRIPIGIPR